MGETLAFGGYQMTYDGIQPGQVADDGRIMDISQITVSQNGRTLADLRPRHDLYLGAMGNTPMNVAGLYSSVQGDFYVLLADFQQPDGATATFKVFVNPLINFIWFGGLILIVGTLVAVWKTESAPVSAHERQRAGQRAEAAV
jgi:cytochrome c-type biogenesis protein CcmF